MRPLLEQIGEEISKVTANGAYEGASMYQTIVQQGVEIEVVIPPRRTAVPSPGLHPPSQRDRHLDMIKTQGWLAWQVATGYGQRALVETTIGCYKSLISLRLRAGEVKRRKQKQAPARITDRERGTVAINF